MDDKKINLFEILDELYENIFEARKKSPWRHLPRKTTLRKGHIRVTKRGIEYVSPHVREYPTKFEEPKKGRRKKKIEGKELERAKERELMDTERALNELRECYI